MYWTIIPMERYLESLNCAGHNKHEILTKKSYFDKKRANKQVVTGLFYSIRKGSPSSRRALFELDV